MPSATPFFLSICHLSVLGFSQRLQRQKPWVGGVGGQSDAEKAVARLVSKRNK
jgi:hypothetical protein